MPPPQRSLFDTDPEPWEADDQAEQLAPGLCSPRGRPRSSTTSCPTPSATWSSRGAACWSRWARAIGWCKAIACGWKAAEGTAALKSVAEVVDRQSLLSPAMLRLTRWIADYYLCSWGQVLETVLPAGVRGQAGTRMATLLTLDPRGAELLAAGSLPRQAGRQSFGDWPRRPSRSLRRTGPEAHCSPAPIATLRRKGLIRARTARVSSRPAGRSGLPREQQLTLNADQQKALDAVLAALAPGSIAPS